MQIVVKGGLPKKIGENFEELLPKKICGGIR